ncbi:beta-1,3-galactosyltransferase 5-like [Anneissia japonica]|uniref:beta-1,3-galactosyltransferase 5-like n=1 Tax=Anneissia japonica TaxID=1529436 RepID=UPI001425AD9E|nr:beta-1,3-galactosyltransferase 5-like [Anneissia japonica]
MKRKLTRCFKYTVFIATLGLVALVPTSILRLQDKSTTQRRLSGRNSKINIANLMHSSEIYTSLDGHKFQLYQNDSIDGMLKQARSRFDNREKLEEQKLEYTEEMNGKTATTRSIVQRALEMKTTLSVATIEDLEYKHKITNNNVENYFRPTTKTQRIGLLRELAEKLTKNQSVVTIKSRDLESTYVIRRTNQSIKITRTKPLYPTDQVNDFNIAYIIPNENACKGDPEVFVVAMMLNQHTDYTYRRFVREYSGKARVVNDKRIQHIFLLGKTNNETLQQRTEQESNTFGDIVQGDFLDTYGNLTLKTLMGFQWIRDFCSEATFVLKVDSDIIVNYNALIPHLVTSPTNGFVEGRVQASAYPLRSKYSKWYIAEEDYPETTYPPYCLGPSYLMSTDVSTQVLHTAHFVRFLPWEDVYVGLVLKRLNITNIHKNSRYFVLLKKNNIIWNKICVFQQIFTLYVGRRFDKSRLKIIFDRWSNKVNCRNVVRK